MKFNFQKPIGFVALLVLSMCLSTFANEQNRIATKLMQTQNCSFDISSYNLSSDNVQALRAQQLETIQNVNQITKLSMDKLVEQNSALRSLALTLVSGLRFGNNFVTRPEDIQLGTGALNYRENISSTGDVLKRFGHELNEMVEQLKMVSELEPMTGFLQIFDINQQHWFARKLNQIIDSTLNRMIRIDFRQATTFHRTFVTVLNGFKFGSNLRGNGRFNLRKSVQNSNELLKGFANGLIDISNQWEQQLVQQQQKCELYLKDTFTPVEINLRSNTTNVVVVGINETMQANVNSTSTVPAAQEVQSNLTTTVSPVGQVQSNLTITVLPVSQVVANLTSIAKQLNIDQLLTNLTNSYGQQNVQQLATQILSIFNATSF